MTVILWNPPRPFNYNRHLLRFFPSLEYFAELAGAAYSLQNTAVEGVRISDQLSKQALLLELRKEHLAVGCAVRRDLNIHLFDAKKLVGKQRTAEGVFASKSRCLGFVD